MDKCIDCPKTAEYPYEDSCPVCGENALVEYIEPSIIWKCCNCGGLVGDGFWTKCAMDSSEYVVSVTPARYTRAQIIIISKLLSGNVTEVYTKISSEPIRRTFSLFDAVSVIRQLNAAGIENAITPQLEYSRIFICH